MQFLYPGFLWALWAVMIPLIIHLFQFRRYRRIYFPNVRLIEDLKMQTQRRSRLKHILVLLARMLFVALLVLAFAQPYRPLREGQVAPGSQRHVVLYVDNSFSMEAVSEDGTLLQVARERAGEIAAAFGPSDQFALLANDFEGRYQRFFSRDELLESLQSLENSPVSRNADEVVTRAQDLLKEKGVQGDLYILSDFQLSFLNPETFRSDSTMHVILVPLQAGAVSNVYVDSCWFLSPLSVAGQNATLRVRVSNSGEGDYEKVPLRLKLNGQQRAVATIDVPAGQSREVDLALRLDEAGWYQGAVEITDYPVTYDDRFHLAFEVHQRIPVLAVYEQVPSPYLAALFGRDSLFRFSSANVMAMDYGRLGDQSLLILDGLNRISSGMAAELHNFVTKGGSLLIFPGEAVEPEGYDLLLQRLGTGRIGAPDTAFTRVADLETGHPLFEGVFEAGIHREGQRTDLPEVRLHYPLLLPATGSQAVVLSLENGRPFLITVNEGMGKAYLFASPLIDKAGTLGRHAIIVPMLYRIAMLSRPLGSLAGVIGREGPVVVQGNGGASEVLTMSRTDGSREFIPELRRQGGRILLNTYGQIREDGVYEVRDKDSVWSFAAYNYSRAESDLRYFTAEELGTFAGEVQGARVDLLDLRSQDVQQAVADLNEGVKFWKWFIWFALAMLLLEVLLLRFMKG